MKMQTSENELVRGGINVTEKRFGILATPKAFQILSDGLYSDKIKSIIRELSCNALDSHVMAGKATVPFRVHLPNILEPYFEIRDFGTGITEEDIYSIYTTYFCSTKADSNDQIGCLGLGSKSPFAYVDAFTVVSIINGEAKTYSVFKNENSEPCTVLMNVEKSDESSGLAVQFPVKSEDFVSFKTKAQSVYTYFKVKPDVRGGVIDLEESDIRFQNDLFRMRYQDYNGARAIMGSVCYPLSDLNDSSLSEVHNKVLGSCVDIYFNIGELNVAASREKIGYNPETVKNIKAKLIEVYNGIQPVIQSHIDECESLWDARILYRDYINSEFSKMIEKFEMMYKGSKLLEQISVSDIITESCFDICPTTNMRTRNKDNNFEIDSYTLDRKGKVHRSSSYTSVIFPTKTMQFFIDDLKCNNITNRVRNYLESQPPHTVLMLVKFNDDSYVSRLKDCLGIKSDFKRLSSLPFVKKPRTYTSTGTTETTSRAAELKSYTTFVYTDKGVSAPSTYWIPESLNPSTGGVYVVIEGFRISTNGNAPKNYFDNIFDKLAKLGLPTNFKVYGIRAGSTELISIESDSNWIEANEYVKLKYKEFFDTDSDFRSWFAWNMNKQIISGTVSSTFISELSSIRKHYTNSDLDYLHGLLNVYTKNTSNYYTNLISYSNMTEYIHGELTSSMKEVGLIERLRQFKARYPMLNLMRNWFDYDERKVIAEYIRMVDQSNKE